MSPEEWDSAPWHVQRLYAEGLVQDEILAVGESPEQMAERDGMTHRQVDTGAGVIDLAAMREQFAAARY